MNDKPEMSKEEINELYSKAVAPLGLTLVTFFVYFYYMMENFRPVSMLDIMVRFGVPFFFISLSVMFIAVERAYYQRVRGTFNFHAKRLGIKMMLGLMYFVFLLGLFLLFDVMLTPKTGKSDWAFLLAFFASSVAVVASTRFHRLRRVLGKLNP